MQKGKAIGVNISRAANVRRGIRVEVFTVMWMVIEAVVSNGAGLLAGRLTVESYAVMLRAP